MSCMAGLIVMRRDSATALAAMKVGRERLHRALSDMYWRESERETAKMGYAYGDHSNRSEP